MNPPPAVHPQQILKPTWVRQPSAADVSAYYPKAAFEAKAQGSAMIMCRVSVDGGLYACRVLSEGPEGEGFGKAALGMTGLFEMRPMMIGNTPVPGASVKIPVKFTIAKESEGPAIATAVGLLCVLAAIGFGALVLLGQRLIRHVIEARRTAAAG